MLSNHSRSYLMFKQDRPYTYNVTLICVRETIVAVENKISIVLFVCACACARECVALIIQHAKRYESYYTVICMDLPHFSVLSKKGILSKKITEDKVCFDFLYNFYLKNFSL